MRFIYLLVSKLLASSLLCLYNSCHFISKLIIGASKENNLFRVTQPLLHNQTTTLQIVTQKEKKCCLICAIYHPNSFLKLPCPTARMEVNLPNKPNITFLKRSAWFSLNRDHMFVSSHQQWPRYFSSRITFGHDIRN